MDRKGLLTINEHGNRRVTRLERTGTITVLADRYEGKRLNSPNDLVYRSDGTLYFTDPPFGLPKAFDDPRKELPFSGVYMVKDGQVTLLTEGAERTQRHRLLAGRALPVRRQLGPEAQGADALRGRGGRDASPSGKVFYDFTRIPEPVALDGIKVDEQGNVYVSAPGGVWILSPEGKPLGRIVPPEHDANFTFGDADGRSLYLTASTGLYRVRVNVPGIRPGAAQQAAAR